MKVEQGVIKEPRPGLASGDWLTGQAKHLFIHSVAQGHLKLACFGVLSSTLGRSGSFLGLENFYIISDHFNHIACLSLSTFSHGLSWVLGAGRAGEYQLLPVLQWWTEAGVYVPQLPPLGERISGNSIPRELHSSCPWLSYFLLCCLTFSPGSLTVTSCSHFPARLSLDQKRKTSGNSVFLLLLLLATWFLSSSVLKAESTK